MRKTRQQIHEEGIEDGKNHVFIRFNSGCQILVLSAHPSFLGKFTIEVDEKENIIIFRKQHFDYQGTHFNVKKVQRAGFTGFTSQTISLPAGKWAIIHEESDEDTIVIDISIESGKPF